MWGKTRGIEREGDDDIFNANTIKYSHILPSLLLRIRVDEVSYSPYFVDGRLVILKHYQKVVCLIHNPNII